MQPSYVGIDIAKSSFAVAIPQPQGGYQDYTLTNDEVGFTQLIARLPANSQCFLEDSGPYYLPLALFLTHHQQALSVLNPPVVRCFSQMRPLRRSDSTDQD